MLSSSELKFINVRSWFFDRHRNLCFDLFRKTCCHGTLSRLAYSMIDYLSFPDNTILIIIDIHTSSFRSMFALLQCLCHCRPWIIQNYKIMSLFLTCCCASSRIFFQNLSSGSVGDEEKCFGKKCSIVVCICIYIFPKSIRWWCGIWGEEECFWNVQSLFFQQMLPRHCPQSQHCSRDIAVSRDEDCVENNLKIWAILAVQTWSGPYAYENFFVTFAKTIWKYGQ